MQKQSLITLVAAAALGAATLAAATPTDEPLYIFDGQYTATLQQHSHRWQLQPLRGDAVVGLRLAEDGSQLTIGQLDDHLGRHR